MIKQINLISIILIGLGIGSCIYIYKTLRKPIDKIGKLSINNRYASTIDNEFIYPLEIPSQPRLFFHGSGQKIDCLKPKSISKRNENEGNVVFATSYLSYAVLFTLALPRNKKDLNFSIRLRSFDHGPHIVLCNNKESWLKYDTGGYIHVVSSKNFYVDLGFLGMTRKQWMSKPYDPEWGSLAEWVSKEETPVLHVFKIDNTLNTLLSLGVQVFFLDDDLFKEYTKIKNDSSLREFMKKLTSENELRGVGFKKLWNY